MPSEICQKAPFLQREEKDGTCMEHWIAYFGSTWQHKYEKKRRKSLLLFIIYVFADNMNLNSEFRVIFIQV